MLEDAYITSRYVGREFSMEEVESSNPAWRRSWDVSERLLVEEAKHRRRVFESLNDWLEVIRAVVKKMDPEASLYLFGSVAENKHTYSSDVDILVATRMKAENVRTELWRGGVTSLLETHVIPPERLHLYEKRGRLVKLS